MDTFVNRKTEIQKIHQILNTLQAASSGSTLTPIYEFYGVGGIGKSTLLRQATLFCSERQLPYIEADAEKDAALFFPKIVQQIHGHTKHMHQQSTWENDRDASIHAIRLLLKKDAVVVLFDSLDSASPALLRDIKVFLYQLIDNNKLFVVLASKKKFPFENDRLINRKLQLFLLKPFDQRSCQDYLHSRSMHVDPVVRDMIYNWTHGYPLAVNVLLDEMQMHQLDPRNDQDRDILLTQMMTQVMKRGVFSNTTLLAQDAEWCQTMLSLFSIPRRSNFPLMQVAIETFAPKYARSSVAAYTIIPRKLNQTTAVFDWSDERSGFAVEPSIRHIFQTVLKLREPDLYNRLQHFLARWNQRQAEMVSGTDRIRHLIEYLYHSANEQRSDLEEIVEQTIHQIIHTHQQEASDIFEYCFQSFEHDHELQSALGTTMMSARSLLYKERAKINREVAREESGEECIWALHDFFYYHICDPLPGELSATIHQYALEVAADFPQDVTAALYQELLQDKRLTEVLGNEFDEALSPLKQRDDA